MGIKERKEREAKARKELIAQTAMKLFLEKGYPNVTMKEISDASEYGMAVIYSAFSSKEELYSCVYFESLRILAGMLERAIDKQSDDFTAEILHAIDILIDFYRDHHAHYRALFVDLYFPVTRLPPVRMEEFQKLIEHASEPVVTLLARGMQAGVYREDDPAQLHIMIWTSIMGQVTNFIQWGFEEEIEVIRQTALKMISIFLQGITLKK